MVNKDLFSKSRRQKKEEECNTYERSILLLPKEHKSEKKHSSKKCDGRKVGGDLLKS